LGIGGSFKILVYFADPSSRGATVYAVCYGISKAGWHSRIENLYATTEVTFFMRHVTWFVLEGRC
jgi:hypothetical protein